MGERFKVWAAQVRAPFLLLAVVLVFIGGSLAYNAGRFDMLRFILCVAGTVLAHASVNLFNELSDYRTGIDSSTRRTPFSGGSGNLQAGLTTASSVSMAAWGTLTAATAAGLYLTMLAGWPLLIFIIIGALVTVFYTSHLAKIAMGELFAGLCLGSMVVVGTYFAMTGQVTDIVILVSVPPGILTSLLLFLNEFPDLEADLTGGRRHLVILLGRKKASMLYVLALSGCYIYITLGILTGLFPGALWITYLSAPLAFRAGRTAIVSHDDFERMVPALAANVGTVLGMDLLIAVAYLIA